MSEPKPGDIVLDMSTGESWKKLGQYRLVACQQGSQHIGPIMQEAWRRTELGEIRWVTVPTIYVTVGAFMEMLK